jgi:hypothetical protein
MFGHNQSFIATIVTMGILVNEGVLHQANIDKNGSNRLESIRSD